MRHASSPSRRTLVAGLVLTLALGIAGIGAAISTGCQPSRTDQAGGADADVYEQTSVRWRATRTFVRTRFPDVRHVSTEALAAELDEAQTARPLLIDARTSQEFAVSHLAQASRVGSLDEALALLQDEPRTRAIVAYCSVGYRSSQLAAALQGAGYENVRNLEGSIFAWANEGRPLVNARGATTLVHPYDERWGALLRPELRAPAAHGD